MPITILMPALSPTMTEGTLLKWHKKMGDLVKAGDLVAEIETDKATMEIEAVDEGTIGKILIAEKTEGVKVNTPIAFLLEKGEKVEDLVSYEAPLKVDVSSEILSSPSLPTAPNTETTSGRVFASPLAKRMLTKKG